MPLGTAVPARVGTISSNTEPNLLRYSMYRIALVTLERIQPTHRCPAWPAGLRFSSNFIVEIRPARGVRSAADK